MSFLSGLLSGPGLTSVTNSVGAYQGAQADAKKQRLRDAMQAQAMERQTQQDMLRERIGEANIKQSLAAAERAARPERDPTKDHATNRAYDLANPTPPPEGAPLPTTSGYATRGGKIILGENGKPLMPVPTQASYQFPTAVDTEGRSSVFRADTRSGEIQDTGVAGKESQAGSGANRGSFQMRKDITANKTQMAIIDEAIAELEKHPEATGLKRGLGLLPGMGEFAGQVNQRFDPEGEPARNAMENLSSLVFLDRSGKAVTKSEMARQGFVPVNASKSVANIEKLRALKRFAEKETRFIEEALANAQVPTAPVGVQTPQLRATDKPAAPANVPTYEEWKAAQAKP